jgi:DNA damage-inducible protein 1
VPSREQQLELSGKVLNDIQTLKQAGVGDSDMLILVRRKAGRQDVSDLASSLMSALGNIPRSNAAPSTAPRSNPTSLMSAVLPFTKPSSDTPEGWLEQAKNFATSAKNQPALLAQLQLQSPQLVDAVNNAKYGLLIQYLQHMAERAEEQRLNLLAKTNPDHPDVQKHIEEQIRRKTIEEQIEYAMEHNPESFASVVMLYCKVEVNGHPISALIDSGAQMTIMSKACAERCGVLRYLDTRMASVARGVGESKILGKIHSAVLKIGNQFIDVSISVIEQNTLEFIFGLDMMRKHRAIIDLAQDALILNDEKIKFLSEGEMPDRIRGSNGIKTSAEIARDHSARMELTSAPPDPAAPTAPQTASSPAQHNHDPSKVKQLVEMMGVPEALAIQALNASNGDLDAAAGFLLSASR